MNEADRSRLQRILASFDEAGLVALANVGLVRRARKDLEAGGVTHEEADAAVLVRGPGWVVTMPPEGPTHAKDTTQASGVTRQILAATLYLRNHWQAAAAPAAAPTGEEKPAAPPPEATFLQEDLLALELADLEKWAGKTGMREALVVVGNGVEVEVESHAGLTIRLIRHEVEARLLPGPRRLSGRALLDAILTTAPKAHHVRWVLVSVLAFQHSRGKVLESPETNLVREEEAGAPRTRQQVLEATRHLLEGMVGTGLAHPSNRHREQLFTLSISTIAVHLPRLARGLRALADDVDHQLKRDATADTAHLYTGVCRTAALAEALAAAGSQPPLTLAGRHRTQYDPVGDLVLAGVGAYPWRSGSGFEGLTVLFWDLAAARFRTWTASRPVGIDRTFSISQVYRTESVWSAGAAINLSRVRLTLRQARANPQGRLSGGQQSKGEILEATQPERLDFGARAFSTWSRLLDHARSQYPIGLKEHDPLDMVVVVKPTKWGERWFDELQQRFCWRLEDDQGAPLTVTLPWTGINESAVAFLEALSPVRDRLSGVVCRLVFMGRGMQIEPLSLLSEGTPQGHHVLNPAFDQALITSKQSALVEKLRAKFGRDRIPTTMTADDDEGDSLEASVDDAPPGLRLRLRETERWLLRTSEAGLGRARAETEIRRLAVDLDRAGFPELSHGLSDVQGGSAAALLRAGYLCDLHKQALVLEGMQIQAMNAT
jgi:hypothetical protein